MLNCGNCYGRGIDAPMQVFNLIQRGAAELPGHGLCPGRIGIHYCNQFHSVALLLKLVIDAGVVLAKSAYTDDCYPDWTSVMQAVIFADSNESRKDYHLLCSRGV